MTTNPPAPDFQNKNRAAILAELKQEKKKLIMQNQSSMNNPGASIPLSRPAFAKDFRDHAEQQHIAAQQKAALQRERERERERIFYLMNSLKTSDPSIFYMNKLACTCTFIGIFHNSRLGFWKSYSSCFASFGARISTQKQS
ncbi:SOSS complex subunit C isoform X2 [Hemitrygon akajei]|uniref:SOSS complex subunit C isoform X2 n=1 Tax=Hemitrygon akajei TaxID=2704970 RepID=UPI003BF94763